MLRLTVETVGAAETVLKVEGNVVAEWRAFLEHECQALLQHHRPLRLDLSAVSYVDREGLRMLRAFPPDQLILEGCSPLLQELFGQEERA